MKSRVTQFKFKGSVLLLLLTAGILGLTPVSIKNRASAAVSADSGALRKAIFGRSDRLPVYGLFDAAVTTDKSDYSPGQIVHISGSGFLGGEAVQLQVVYTTPSSFSSKNDLSAGYASGHLPWVVTADQAGNFTADWLVENDSLGQTLLLTADGLSSGLHASVVFTDNIGYNKGVYNKGTTDPDDTTGVWTTGNAGSNYLENQWAYYQYQVTGVSTTTPTFDVTFNHFQSNTQAVFVDAFANFRACLNCTDSTHTSGPSDGMLLDGVPFPPVSTANWVDAHSAISLINGTIDQNGQCVATEDPVNVPSEEHCFHVNGAALQALFPSANFTSGSSNNITLFYEAHLASSFVWSKGNEYLLGCSTNANYVSPGPEVIPANTVFGTAAYSGGDACLNDNAGDWTTPFDGVGFATGSSRHFNLTNQSAGSSGAITLPIPTVPAPTGSITVVKQTVPATAVGAVFGYTGDLGAFNLDTDPSATNPSSITFTQLAGGATFTVNEATMPAGWSFVSVNCVGDGTFTYDNTTRSAHVTLGTTTGASVTCTYINNGTANLTLVKRIVNDNGGTATVGNFGITTNAGSLTFGSGVSDGTSTLKYTSNTLNVSAGAYSLHEGTLTGYNEGTWACTAGNVTNTTPQSGSVTLAPGDNAVCTITNNDQPASLTIVKRIVNDSGGTAVVSAFGLSTNAGSLSFGSGVADGANTLKYTATTLTGLSAATYTLHENDIAGYTEGSWACTGGSGAVNTNFNTGSVALNLGESVTCTITNNDDQGSLQIIKRVVNDNGGTATVANFGLNTSAGALTFGAGVADGANTLKYSSQVISVNAGPYTLRESDVAGYTEGTWSCTGATPTNTSINLGSVTVPNGVAVVCTITNDDQAGSLQLVKRVINDNGGTKTVSDFGLSTSAGPITFGSGAADGANTLRYSSNVITVSAGSYTFSELDVAGYTEGTWSCTGASASGTAFNAGSVTVPNGVAVVCTITNNDDQGSLQIVKRVVNDNGGTATVANFGLNTSAGALVFGSGVADGANTLKYSSGVLAVNAGPYTFSESDVAGYTEGTWSCTGASATGTAFNSGSVTVPNGVAVVCTITNDDQAGSLQLVKRVVNNSGGTATVANFGLVTNAGALTFGSGVADGASTLKYSSNVLTVNAGGYTFSENDVVGYTEGTWACTGAAATGTAFGAGSVTVPNGVAVVCTITNDDQPGTLQLIKRVVNDNGGTATVSAFGITTTGGALTFGGGVADGANTLKYSSNVLSVSAGSYSLHENAVGGYTEGIWSCTGATPTDTSPANGAVSVPNGGAVVCTITNDDQPGTIIIRKITVPLNSPQSFDFDATGTGYNDFSITGVSTGGANLNTQQLNAGVYSVKEINIPADWILTGVGSPGTTSCQRTVSGAGTSSGVGDTNTATATITLNIGDTVLCTFENTHTLVTRTQGFWATHPQLAQLAWFGGTDGNGHVYLGVANTPGIGDITLCGRPIDSLEKLMGGFWAQISQDCSDGRRSKTDQDRMTLLQQLLAAELNASAFGSVPIGGISKFQEWEDAFCGSNSTAINTAKSQAAGFNESGDNGLFTPGTHADPKNARNIADTCFWNNPANVQIWAPDNSLIQSSILSGKTDAP